MYNINHDSLHSSKNRLGTTELCLHLACSVYFFGTNNYHFNQYHYVCHSEKQARFSLMAQLTLTCFTTQLVACKCIKTRTGNNYTKEPPQIQCTHMHTHMLNCTSDVHNCSQNFGKHCKIFADQQRQIFLLNNDRKSGNVCC